MILYHVSFSPEAAAHSVFMPRVPATCGVEEDKETPRICLAPSVRECIQALSSESRELCEGAKLTVYKVCIHADDPYLRRPNEVVSHVPDALENQEYWYLAPLEMIGKVFIIEGFEGDWDTAWTVISVQDIAHAMRLYVQDREERTMYENAIARAESSYDAYIAIKRKCDYLSNLIMAEVERKNFLWCRIFRIEYVDLVSADQPSRQKSKNGWKRDVETLSLAEWYGIEEQLDTLFDDIKSICYISDIEFDLYSVVDGSPHLGVFITPADSIEIPDDAKLYEKIEADVDSVFRRNHLTHVDAYPDGRSLYYKRDCSVWIR